MGQTVDKYTYFGREINESVSRTSFAFEQMSTSLEKSVSLLEKHSKYTSLTNYALNFCLVSSSIAMLTYSWAVYKKNKNLT